MDSQMNKIDPLKEKYHGMYWAMVDAAAAQSCAQDIQVGCVIVTTKGMISIGYNGMPPGCDNVCEHPNGRTRSEVIHSEMNALDKFLREGVSTEGAHLFVTLSPCINCAKSIAAAGITHVFYKITFKDRAGIELLEKAGVNVWRCAEDY